MNRFLLILGFSCCIFHAKAQISVRAGINGGIDNCTMSDFLPFIISNHDHGPFPGNHFGIDATIKINKIVGFEVDLDKSTVSDLYTDKAHKINISYLDIPIFFRLSTNGKVGFYFETGLQYSILLNGNNKLEVADTTLSIKDFYRKGLAGFVIGLGLEFKITDKVILTAGARAASTIITVAKDNYYTSGNVINDIYYHDNFLSKAGFHFGVAWRFHDVSSWEK